MGVNVIETLLNSTYAIGSAGTWSGSCKLYHINCIVLLYLDHFVILKIRIPMLVMLNVIVIAHLLRFHCYIVAIYDFFAKIHDSASGIARASALGRSWSQG